MGYEALAQVTCTASTVEATCAAGTVHVLSPFTYDSAMLENTCFTKTVCTAELHNNRAKGHCNNACIALVMVPQPSICKESSWPSDIRLMPGLMCLLQGTMLQLLEALAALH